MDTEKVIYFFYQRVIKWILLPLAGKTNPFFDRLVEKHSCATRGKHLFSLVAQYTILILKSKLIPWLQKPISLIRIKLQCLKQKILIPFKKHREKPRNEIFCHILIKLYLHNLNRWGEDKSAFSKSYIKVMRLLRNSNNYQRKKIMFDFFPFFWKNKIDIIVFSLKLKKSHTWLA